MSSDASTVICSSTVGYIGLWFRELRCRSGRSKASSLTYRVAFRIHLAIGYIRLPLPRLDSFCESLEPR